MLAVGASAPDFEVGDTTLRALLKKGRVVVFFYPKAFTPGWTQEARGFREQYAELEKAGAGVVGVSADSQETNDRFAAALGLPYPLIGDPNGDIRAAYQVKWPILGLARRTTYVIGTDGRIEKAYRSERDAESHVSEACEVVLPRSR